MEVIVLLIRLMLATVFAVAGIGKLLDLEGSEKALKDFGVPNNLAKSFAFGLPIAEIVIAIFFVAGFDGLVWRGRRFFAAIGFYRRNVVANGTGKCAGLPLLRANSQRAGFLKKHNSQCDFCFFGISACFARTRKSGVKSFRFIK